MESALTAEKQLLTILPKQRVKLTSRVEKISQMGVEKLVDIYISKFYENQNKDQFPTIDSFKIYLVKYIKFYVEYYQNLLKLDEPFATKSELEIVMFIETYFSEIITHGEGTFIEDQGEKKVWKGGNTGVKGYTKLNLLGLFGNE